MKLLRKVSSIFDSTINVLAIFGAALIILLMVGVCSDVFLRNAFSRPIGWMSEITTYTLLWMTFLGATWVLKGEAHVKVEVFSSRLKPGPNHLLIIVTSIISAIVFLIITYYSGLATWKLFEEGYYLFSVLRPLKWPIFIIIPIGSFMLAIQLLRRAHGCFKSWKSIKI